MQLVWRARARLRIFNHGLGIRKLQRHIPNALENRCRRRPCTPTLRLAVRASERGNQVELLQIPD